MSLLESLKSGWESVVGAESSEAKVLSEVSSAPANAETLEEPPPRPRSPSDRVGAARYGLWVLRMENRTVLATMRAKVAELTNELRRLEVDLSSNLAVEDQTLAPLAETRAQLARERAALDALVSMETPSPASIAEEEAIRRRIPRLEATEAEQSTAHEAASRVCAENRKSIRVRRERIVEAEAELESWQLGADATESFQALLLRGFEHAARYPTHSTNAARFLGTAGSTDRQLLNFVTVHREFARKA